MRLLESFLGNLFRLECSSFFVVGLKMEGVCFDFAGAAPAHADSRRVGFESETVLSTQTFRLPSCLAFTPFCVLCIIRFALCWRCHRRFM